MDSSAWRGGLPWRIVTDYHYLSRKMSESNLNASTDVLISTGPEKLTTLERSEFQTAESTPVQSPEKSPVLDTRIELKIHIPQEQYSNINFIALLVGYRGNTLKE